MIDQIKKGATHFAAYVKKIIDDFFKWLEDLFKSGKADDIFDNITGNGLYGGKVLSKAELDDWAKILLKKFGTKLKKVEKFDSPDILAQFDPNTNTILYKNDVTEYFMVHEHFHAEEMSKIGFDEYVKDAALFGTKFPNEYTVENLLRSYKREKYVYEQIEKNAKRYNLNPFELRHNYLNLDIYQFHLEKRNVKIPK
ncbi:zincin-like metallopeptidase toxin domain-containing protein [Flavobacterium dankookense]|uniref:Zincin-like metallopeptidase toxin 4 of polymorphic toxin system n=1 Tax=Flavobacterium dankookense TaxID=706186 RepID=A0A4R6QDX5_9FLAO|nr:zincin-like metallopeptidase toxin domain-containing protein [Flavobacterium dankookense]TDP60093.1 zincin-like metallopeptidase toxin 4 of polymorphic toxin system [Flavobacterium dankookense]